MGWKVRKFDLDPITYFDIQKRKLRKYYPDFIIEDLIITEVKHVDGFIFEKKKKEIESKQRALDVFCKKSERYMSLFVSNKMIDVKLVNEAKKIHKGKKPGKKKK